MEGRILYIFDKAPHTSAHGLEMLEASMVGASMELGVDVLFIGDGVFQLKSHQKTTDSRIKSATKAFPALVDFGIENVYVHSPSLIARGLDTAELIVESKLLESDELAAVIQKSEKVVTL